jgi:hypothetical protein
MLTALLGVAALIVEALALLVLALQRPPFTYRANPSLIRRIAAAVTATDMRAICEPFVYVERSEAERIRDHFRAIAFEQAEINARSAPEAAHYSRVAALNGSRS